MSDCYTILVVEDEESLLKMTSQYLSIKGYSVIEASNFYNALELFKQNEPKISLVLTDLGLSGKESGLDLIREIKSINPVMPIILTSGDSESPLDFAEIKNSKAAFFLPKPYMINQLEDLMLKCFSALD